QDRSRPAGIRLEPALPGGWVSLLDPRVLEIRRRLAAGRPLPGAGTDRAVRAGDVPEADSGYAVSEGLSGAAGSSTTKRAPPRSDSSSQIFPPTSATTR